MTSDGTIVHIIDDDDALRDSLSFLLDAAGMKVQTYETALAFLDALPAISAGCVITDVRMPGLTGIDLLRQLRDAGQTLPVIVVTGHADVPLAVTAMRLGAVDFLEKPFDDEVLLGAVRAALARQAEVDKEHARKAEAQGRISLLSVRERQVLEGLVAGNPNKTIAYDLGISPRTVEIYRANVMTKMEAASLSDLVRMAMVAGALPEIDEGPARK